MMNGLIIHVTPDDISEKRLIAPRRAGGCMKSGKRERGGKREEKRTTEERL